MVVRQTLAPPRARHLDEALSAFDQKVSELARHARLWLWPLVFDTVELVYDNYNAVAIGYSFSGRTSDHFCHLAVYRAHVNIGFPQGTSLPDPGLVLTGTGKTTKHVRIESINQLRQRRLRELVLAARELASRPATPSPAIGTSILKSVSANRRPRR